MWLILLIILGIVLYYLLQGKFSGTNGSKSVSSKPSETPIEILKKRYARGEISKEEFNRIRQDLE